MSISVGHRKAGGVVVGNGDVASGKLGFGRVAIDGGNDWDDEVLGVLGDAVDLGGEGVGAGSEGSEAIGMPKGRKEGELVGADGVEAVAVKTGDFVGSEEGDRGDWRRDREFGGRDLC